jgi:O-antigen biosynthesis protein WbqP
MIKRFFDIAVASTLLLVLSPVMIFCAVLIRINSPGPSIFWSERFGCDGNLFQMPKFRTMKVGAPLLPTHLMASQAPQLTGIGPFLRQTSLDELPQLYSVLIGDMSLVGPRPALFNQDDLMQLRFESGLVNLRPGVTGWAQINGRDELSIAEKVKFERFYLEKQSFFFDLTIIFLTIIRVVGRQGVSH